MKSYKSVLLSFTSLAVTSLALAAISDVKAQVLSPSSNSNAVSGSNANAGASSGAVSGSNLTINNPAQPTNTTATENINTRQSGYVTGDQIIRNAPTVYVPNVVTGNVCSLGASAGASWLGAGFAVGGTWESQQCERRQQAALLHNAGYKEASHELMCDQREVYEAMKRAGTPCLPRPAWDPAPAPGQPQVVVQRQPTQIVPVAPQPAAFQPANYPGMSDCLTAAYAAKADPAYCRGKR